MAKKQTRRSVSIRGATYDQIRGYCERNGLSMSEFFEDLTAKFFNGTRPQEALPKTTVEPTPVEKPAPVVIEKRHHAPIRSNGSKLDFDQLQEAARFFTF